MSSPASRSASGERSSTRGTAGSGCRTCIGPSRTAAETAPKSRRPCRRSCPSATASPTTGRVLVADLAEAERLHRTGVLDEEPRCLAVVGSQQAAVARRAFIIIGGTNEQKASPGHPEMADERRLGNVPRAVPQLVDLRPLEFDEGSRRSYAWLAGRLGCQTTRGCACRSCSTPSPAPVAAAVAPWGAAGDGERAPT